jgi:hypothetical protein
LDRWEGEVAVVRGLGGTMRAGRGPHGYCSRGLYLDVFGSRVGEASLGVGVGRLGLGALEVSTGRSELHALVEATSLGVW